MKDRFVSPNEIFEAAKTMELSGKDPVTHEDWEKVAGFIAFNLDKNLGSVALQLVMRIFDSPLTINEVEEIYKQFNTNTKRWEGSNPVNCQICEQPFENSCIKYKASDGTHRNFFIDGKTENGSWGLMCGVCYKIHGVGIGQVYDLITRIKIAG